MKNSALSAFSAVSFCSGLNSGKAGRNRYNLHIMCGITGLLDINTGMTAAEMKAAVTRMADTLRHRGPDDSGAWVDAEASIALGFRRLAILDLSPAGHQPMFSADGS